MLGGSSGREEKAALLPVGVQQSDSAATLVQFSAREHYRQVEQHVLQSPAMTALLTHFTNLLLQHDAQRRALFGATRHVGTVFVD